MQRLPVGLETTSLRAFRSFANPRAVLNVDYRREILWISLIEQVKIKKDLFLTVEPLKVWESGRQYPFRPHPILSLTEEKHTHCHTRMR